MGSLKLGRASAAESLQNKNGVQNATIRILVQKL